jgi:integrase
VSVREIRRGCWEFVTWVPGPAGTRRQLRKRGFPTRKAAREAEAETLTRIAAGTFVAPTSERLGPYLTQTWLPTRTASLKPSTLASYRRLVDAYIVPALGHVRMRDLDAATLSTFYASLSTSGRRQAGGGLSAKTVRNVAGVLHAALADSRRFGLLARNPADDADLPRWEQPELRVWNADELGAFVRFTSADRYAALWTLAATTGMRRGELLGLRWPDVELDAASLSVLSTRTVADYEVHVGSPKTRKGSRVISLDPPTLSALRAWDRTQKTDRVALGPGWTDSGLVFTDPLGHGLRPQWVSREFQRLAGLAGLTVIRLHDVRHSYVTAALSAGVPVKTVSQRVGHANVGVTLGLYAHVLPGDDREAAETVARRIFGNW